MKPSAIVATKTLAKRKKYILTVAVLFVAIAGVCVLIHRLFSFWAWIEVTGASSVAIGCLGELWLLFAKQPTEEEELKTFESKKYLLERVFVGLVAIGVSMELAALPVSLKETAQLELKNLELEQLLQQTHTNVTRMDPFKRRLLEISALVTIHVSPIDLPAVTNYNPSWNHAATMTFDSTNQNVGELMLYGESYRRALESGFVDGEYFEELVYSLPMSLQEVVKDFYLPRLNNALPSVSEVYQASSVNLSVGFLPYLAEVRWGTIDLVINNTVQKRFKIIGHTNPPLTVAKIPKYFTTSLDAVESSFSNPPLAPSPEAQAIGRGPETENRRQRQ